VDEKDLHYTSTRQDLLFCLKNHGWGIEKEALPTSDLFPLSLFIFLRFTMKEVGQDIMDNEREAREMKEMRTMGMATLARA
jgi:hypothetical protein